MLEDKAPSFPEMLSPMEGARDLGELHRNFEAQKKQNEAADNPLDPKILKEIQSIQKALFCEGVVANGSVKEIETLKIGPNPEIEARSRQQKDSCGIS